MKYLSFFFSIVLVFSFISCNNKTDSAKSSEDSVVACVVDTALYGTCGEGTSMHNLQIVTDDGKNVDIQIDPESEYCVKGGLLDGDRITATYVKAGDELIATNIVNITTLLGHWTSLDRNFTILEDGTIESNVSAETKPYTSWAMVNGNLVMNTDTFSVVSLGADSLEIENNKGIFVYKRQK